ncbi:histidine phosphatase family protein [Adhaeribacter sp. BT258]|uniref:Histidine phosphatase family protein n=1 Tax=Adhaeribacter terrigena TaxID=2793070 RepID=A0ABS1C689_9BACT|nr:phosphoglycerate mutase family protein [Adhaeribacter terrigena]MBK0404893.1 histidine phosphatase family protein [Adhaeribacter terrigena]
MKHLLKFLLLLLNLTWLVSCAGKKSDAKPVSQEARNEKATIVYLVRHAEKSSNHPDDPDLSAAGQARAEALKNLLRDKGISAIYSTNYKRTRQTAQPLAEVLGLKIQFYEAHAYGTITGKILQENRHGSVLVIGHSNSVLELVEAFKAPRPVAQLTDSDYNYLFKVTIPEEGEAQATAEHYGN